MVEKRSRWVKKGANGWEKERMGEKRSKWLEKKKQIGLKKEQMVGKRRR